MKKNANNSVVTPLLLSVAGILLNCAGTANATDGYFSHGYGMTEKGMGGASFATGLDAMSGANNPAGMAWAGDRLDLGVDWFRPDRSAERSGAMPGLNASVTSDSTNFLIPELGYNRMFGADLAAGITIYGNGGMNTNYPGGQLNCGAGPKTANLLCGAGGLGVNLTQLIVAPTLAWKPTLSQSIGIAPLIGYQRFQAQGLQAFDNAPGFPQFTSAPGSVTNLGDSNSTGFGVRVGYQIHLDQFQLGLVYTSRMHMGDLSLYQGLLANHGAFDIPEHYGAGVAYTPSPGLLISFDLERIDYADIPSVGNPGSAPAQLGTPNGPGFGWSNINVERLGMQWKSSQDLTLRAGYNQSQNPVSGGNVTFNILAPGVETRHITLGATYAVGKDADLTVAYMHAFKNTVTGSSMFNSILGPGAGGNESISMFENSLGVAYSKHF